MKDRPSHFGPDDSQVARGVPAYTLCGVATFTSEKRSEARRLGIVHGKQPMIGWSNGWDHVTCKRCLALRGLTQQEAMIERTPARLL